MHTIYGSKELLRERSNVEMEHEVRIEISRKCATKTVKMENNKYFYELMRCIALSAIF
jgi:hypothetical protein